MSTAPERATAQAMTVLVEHLTPEGKAAAAETLRALAERRSADVSEAAFYRELAATLEDAARS